MCKEIKNPTTITDLSLLSLSLESHGASDGPGDFDANVRIDIESPTTEPSDDGLMLGTTTALRVTSASRNDGSDLCTIEMKVGCTVLGTSGESEDELWAQAIESCVGYARALVRGLTQDSAARTAILIPRVDSAWLVADARRKKAGDEAGGTSVSQE